MGSWTTQRAGCCRAGAATPLLAWVPINGGRMSEAIDRPWVATEQLHRRRASRWGERASPADARTAAFRLAHAAARDAVHLPFDAAGLAQRLAAQGFALCRCTAGRTTARPICAARTSAGVWRRRRCACCRRRRRRRSDIVFVVGDGLSSRAVQDMPSPCWKRCARLSAERTQRRAGGAGASGARGAG